MKKVIRRLKRISIKNAIAKGLTVFTRILTFIKVIKPVNKKLESNIELLTSNIPDSNGISYYKKADVNIAVITDEYMYNYYKDAVNLIYVTPDNYKQIIDSNRIDVVMFISCWKGMGVNNDWRGIANRDKVSDVFCYARSMGIKTVFQSIEDPSNYDIFIGIASVADYIFTSCIEKIPDYKKDTGNENVFLLDYGVNPIIHNPIGFLNKQSIDEKLYNRNSLFFAGSWAPRYKERCNDMCMVFDGVIKTKDISLVIADRNKYIKGYNFPFKYSKYIISPIEHTMLQKVHKLFDWTVNINSIKNSLTMCAMRVYEVQALGSLMISNYALSVSNVFPNIFIVFNSDEVGNILNGYSQEQIVNMQIEGIRNVMTKHTVFDKINGVFEKIDIDCQFRQKNVLVLCEEKCSSVVECFDRQTYLQKELYSLSEVPNINQDSFDYVIILQEVKDYGRFFIEDLICAFKYTDVAYTVYSQDEPDLVPYNYVNNTHMLYDTMYDLNKISLKDVVSLERKELNGFLIKEQQYCESTQAEKMLGVIIPVYNNGKYLKDRCMKSLKRSSIFNKMQVYIVDDGSTDIETITIVKEIEKQCDNVTTFFFDDGGSGSASRPRNKGVEMCNEKYVTYLDPDNEAVNDGYAKLFSIVEKKNVDIAFGTILKVADQTNMLSFMYKEAFIANPRQELISRKFKSQSIQACVIKKELITRNNISNPIGAAGQDTTFFYQLMLCSETAYHITLPIHIYYAQRSDSIVNTVDISFFKKFLLLEKYQVQVLKKFGVLDEYKEKKFNYFLQNWYYKKLEQVNEYEKDAAQKIISSIIDLYN